MESETVRRGDSRQDAPRREPAAERAPGWAPADPGPLGLAGFALTTFMLSMFNAGHTYAVIAGLRWDTAGSVGGTGPRWYESTESVVAGDFVVRHPAGY